MHRVLRKRSPAMVAGMLLVKRVHGVKHLHRVNCKALRQQAVRPVTDVSLDSTAVASAVMAAAVAAACKEIVCCDGSALPQCATDSCRESKNEDQRKPAKSNKLPTQKRPLGKIDVATAMLARRSLHVVGDIDKKTAKLITEQLLYLSSVNCSEPIVVYINSNGGSIADGMAMIDVMRALPNQIVTVGLGKVSSMAAILLASGDRRLLFPSCRMMIHEPRYTMSKTRHTDAGTKMTEHAAVADALLKFLLERSNYSEAELRDTFARGDTHLSADEAVQVGLVDAIVGSITDIHVKWPASASEKPS